MQVKKLQRICYVGICIVFCAFLFGCAASEKTPEVVADSVDSSALENVAPQSAPSLDTETKTPKNEKPNMVDERFELLSLVFRLAGHEEYSDSDTAYQQQLESVFSGYREHQTIAYAAELPFGYDAVFSFSVHIQKNGERFELIENIDFLVADGRWTRQLATEFLELLNVFYTASEFAAFYQSNIEFYEEETQRFIDRAYFEINPEWFRPYVDPENLRCIYSPSSTRNNYGATVNGTIVYCAVSGSGGSIVHEYCHSFANPIARNWYEENAEFRNWCDDTINPVKLPNYGNGYTIAGEYVTRAYNALYYADHGYAVLPLLLMEKGKGFPYIEDVYAMITSYEKAEQGGDTIERVLGVKYEMGQERSFSIKKRTFRWRVLTLADELPFLYLQTEVGDIYGSKTGDVLYVEDTVERNPYLLIDLGETSFQGESGYRKYARLPIE